VVVIGMEGGRGAVCQIAEELSAASPESVVLVAYRQDELRPDRPTEDVIGVLRASARDFLRRPVSSAELYDVLRRLVLGSTRASGRVAPVVSFVSNKGGVGKSTLAVNTACLLAASRRDRVLLVDASLQLGVCASMLDLEPETTLADATRQADRLDERLLHNLSTPHGSGLRLLAAPRDAMDAAAVDERSMTRVLNVARRAFDLVVVDTFPMLDSIAVAILDLSDRVIVVVSNMVPNVLGAAAFLSVIERVGVPPGRQTVVLNDTHPSFTGRLKPADVADRLGRTLDHVVPYSKNVLVAMNTGRPASLSAPRWSRFGRAVRSLAGTVSERTAPTDPVSATADASPVDGAEPALAHARTPETPT